MNLGASAIVLRPRPLFEVLDLAFRLSFSLALGLYLRLAAVILLPCLASCLLLRHVLDWPWLAVWAVAVVLGGIVQGVFTVAAGGLLFSEALAARQVLAAFGRRLPSYAATMLVSRGLLALSALPVFLGLPFVWPHLLFVHEASLLENAGPTDAIRRAGRFVANQAGMAFLVLIALLATQAAFAIVGELLGQGLVDHVLQLGRPLGGLFTDGVSVHALAGFFLSVPYVATARFLHYVDARTRSDGWDIQVRFMAVAAQEKRA